MKQRTYIISLLSLLMLSINSYSNPNKENKSLLFLENKGQITNQHQQPRTDIDYKIDGGGVTIFVGDGQLHYQWAKSNVIENDEQEQSNISVYRMDVTLMGANKNVQPIAEEVNAYYETYYLPQFAYGATVKSYKKITYKNIYPNIDWVLYSNERELKYDFVVHQGGKVSDIQLRYDVATTLQLQEGALVATTPYGSITEAAPYTYIKERRKEINSAYQLNGNILSFTTSATDEAIVIDPTLLWTTYYGGTAHDKAYDVATDYAGNAYMAGLTGSTTNIATTGAYQTSFIAKTDGFIAKFNELGIRLWGTYYGGNHHDFFRGIDVDSAGNVYAVLLANSAGLASSGAFLTTISTDVDTNGSANDFGKILLVKLNTNGQRQWATYYGSNGEEFSVDVACDDAGDVYIGGRTSAYTGVATSGTYQTSTSNIGTIYSFLAKFNSSGSRQWGTYYGSTLATGGINIICITTDHSGYVYMGGTSTGNGLATTGAHQTVPARPGANNGGIIAKFSNTGQRIWTTYLGDSSIAKIYGLTCDLNDNLYVTGYTGGHTGSTSNIVTAGAHDTSFNGQVDAFLVKFNPTGVRQWGTYYGGANDDISYGIGESSSGQIFIMGGTTSSSGIANAFAIQPNKTGGRNNFVAAFNPTNGQLTYGSYHGVWGTGVGYAATPTSGIACSRRGLVYVADVTRDTGFATTGAHQTTFSNTLQSGIGDAYLSAFTADSIAYIKIPFNDTVHCPLDTMRVPYGVNTAFSSGNIFSIQLSNASGSFVSAVTIGTRADTTADTIVCVIPKNTPAGTGYRIRITSSSPTHTFAPHYQPIRIKAAPQAFSNSSNSPVCAGDTLQLNGTTTSTGVSWSWAGVGSFSSTAEDTIITNVTTAMSGDYILTATLNSTGCSFKDTATVLVKPLPAKPVATSNSPLCVGDTLTLASSSTTSGVTYSWEGVSSYTSTTQNPTVSTNATATMSGSYISTVTLNGCVSKDTVTAIVHPIPATPIASSNSPLCATQNLNLTANTIINATYTWWGPNGFSATTQNPVRPNASTNFVGAYYVLATVNGCASDTDSVHVAVNPDPQVSLVPSPSNDVCVGQQVTFVSYTNNAGATPSFRWLVNNTVVSTAGTSYATNTLQNGDVVSCEMTSTGTCKSTFIDTSNTINMTVSPVLVPSVSITATPSLLVAPWELVTFTATPVNGGVSPKYQWRRNGQNVIGATNSIWGTYQLSDGDEISVVLYSDYLCPNPDSIESNKLVVNLKLGIETIQQNSFSLFPNPNNGTFTLKGKVNSTETIRLNIINSVGQIVHQQTIKATTSELNEQINTNNLASGVYLLQLQSGSDKQHIRLTIN